MVQVVLTNEVTVSGNCGADVIALLDEIQSVKIGVVKTTSADGLAASVTPG